MNRHRAYWPLDDAPITDGDGAFAGVNMRLSPGQLADGEVAEAVNCRFTIGVAEPRRGNRILTWGMRGQPGTTTVLPYGEVRTASTFRDPVNAQEWLIIATADGTYACSPGSTGARLEQPASTVIPEGTQLVQTYNGMIMLRGPGLNPLYLTDLAAGWRILPEVTDPDAEAIPPSSAGVYWQNRLLVVDARTDAGRIDTVWVSDIGAAEGVLRGADTGYQSFGINQGSADRLVALYPFNQTTLVCAKARSVYVVTNVAGTNEQIAANASLSLVTGEWGCRAPRSLVQVGTDVWFLAHRRGVVSLRMTETNAIQGVDVPVSRDIQPLIDRINWQAADGAVAVNHDNLVMFAVPLDGATYNNAVLVFDLLTGRWAGHDAGAAVKVKAWVKFTYRGATRLGYLSPDGYVYLVASGDMDDLGDGAGHITRTAYDWRWRSRAYGARTPGRKLFGELRLQSATLDPAYTVAVVRDGPWESREVAAITKDPTRYYRPWNRPAWDPTNANNDFNTPYRQDYALAIGAGGFAIGPGGVALDQEQETEEAFRLREQGESCQVEVAGIGRVRIKTLKLDARRGTTRHGTKA